MRNKVTIEEFNCIVQMIRMLDSLELMDGKMAHVMWEKKPRLMINEDGVLEVDYCLPHDEEIYAARIELWGKYAMSTTWTCRYMISR